ncbi:MAG: hypothetical protein HY975_01920 [Candidatus Kerfeldbacteria bacterium]|nr:hypothetical protein [Candidatus Kerfeldbacteria bacterium]
MIDFPASWVQYLVMVLGGLLLLLSLLYLQNAFRHGGNSGANILTSGIFIAGIVVIAWFSLGLLRDVDWSSTFTIELPAVNPHFFGS